MRERCAACGQEFPRIADREEFVARLRSRLAEHDVEFVSCEFGRFADGGRFWRVVVAAPGAMVFRVDLDARTRNASTLAVADGVADRVVRHLRA